MYGRAYISTMPRTSAPSAKIFTLRSASAVMSSASSDARRGRCVQFASRKPTRQPGCPGSRPEDRIAAAASRIGVADDAADAGLAPVQVDDLSRAGGQRAVDLDNLGRAVGEVDRDLVDHRLAPQRLEAERAVAVRAVD